MTRNAHPLVAALVCGALFAGCGGSGGGGGGFYAASTAAPASTPGGGNLEVQVTDAPLQDLTRVSKAEITVTRLEVHVAPIGSASATSTSTSTSATAPAAPTAPGSNQVLPGVAMGNNPSAAGGNPNAGGTAAVGSAAAGGANPNAGGGNANAGGNGQGGTWLTLFDAAQAGAPKVFNLLDLRGGITAELARATLPPGNYTHLRLEVSAGEVVVDRTSYSTQNGLLSIPSGSVQIAFAGKNAIVVAAGRTTQVLLDVDVARSFSSVGPLSNPQRFTLLPTVRGANLSTTGSIAGVVRSDNRTPAVTTDDAPVGSVTVDARRQGQQVTTYTDAQGAYFLGGLDEGTWDVTFQDPAHADQTVQVTVVKQQQATQDVVLVKR